ncbi:sugar ABC transporter substrate-binding protein [Streptomyces brasiliensis]|uniref:Periplasmic binding protein domain-containing protein n=1 Tax=Streptomyces brasiliensis TaxID=1954 RepID=A0A917L4R3_9ACTN|nr:substrate-binding domain-containing protein [Streptomyces brasiliensis]GGJ42834.1 hypothetical protein GCM10010121_062580 [Streptomyces brasiliensis]
MTSNFVKRVAKPALAAALAAGVVSGLAACGSSNATDSSAGGAPVDSSAIGDTAKAAVAAVEGPITSWPTRTKIDGVPDLKGKSIVYVEINGAISSIQQFGVGLTEAMKALGATVTVCDAKSNPTQAADCITKAVDSGAAGIVASSISYNMAPSAIDAATKAGVPVLIAGGGVSSARPADKTLAYYDTGSRLVGVWDLLNDIALQNHGADSSVLWVYNTDNELNKISAQTAIADYKKACPDCGITPISFTTANLSQLPAAISAALVAHPDVNTVIVPVDAFVTQAQQGIQGAGGSSKPDIVSMSGSLAGLQLVKSGVLKADVGYPLIYEGWVYGNALLELMSGKSVDSLANPPLRVFDSSNIGSLKLDQASSTSGVWYGDESYKQAFLTAWGVK